MSYISRVGWEQSGQFSVQHAWCVCAVLPVDLLDFWERDPTRYAPCFLFLEIAAFRRNNFVGSRILIPGFLKRDQDTWKYLEFLNFFSWFKHLLKRLTLSTNNFNRLVGSLRLCPMTLTYYLRGLHSYQDNVIRALEQYK